MTICKENDSKMESALRKLIIFVVIAAFMLPLLTPKVFAASSVTISGGDNVKGGDTFTVAVTYGGGSVGRVDGQLTYDTNKLTYLSGGSSSGNTGNIQLKKAGTGEAIVFNIKFQAVAEGSTGLNVTTNEAFNLDEEYIIDSPSTSKTISIAGNANEDELIMETASPDQPGETTEPKGVDEKPEASVSPTMILIIAAVIALVLIAIIIVVLMTKKKKNVQPNSKPLEGSETADETMGEDVPPTANGNIGYDSGDNFEYGSNNSIKYDSDGNIVRRSQMSKNKSQKNKKPKDKAAKKKYSNEETESWDDWGGWDDNEK